MPGVLREGTAGARWGGVAATILLLAAGWGVTFLAGGTRTVWPHLFYLPVMVAALLFGLRGGILAGLAATVLCGPLMPLDVAAGHAQSVASWVPRGAFYLSVGTLAGGMLRSLRRGYERELIEQFRQEMEVVESPSVDLAVYERIADLLRTRSFHPVFQPIYSLADGRLVAVEALTRFDAQPSQPPNVWFDEASRAGLGADLEIATVEAILDASGWIPAGVALTVNCSPTTLTEPRFLELARAQPPGRLIVEVTEHAVVEDYQQVADAVAELRGAGVRLAVDDAGAGFASLRHIVRLAPDIIKLDISLTQHLRDDPVRRALADCLVRFAHEAGCELIAEGIEHPADLTAWTQLGAHAAQGYLLGRPGPSAVLTTCPAITGDLGLRTTGSAHAHP